MSVAQQEIARELHLFYVNYRKLRVNSRKDEINIFFKKDSFFSICRIPNPQKNIMNQIKSNLS